MNEQDYYKALENLKKLEFGIKKSCDLRSSIPQLISNLKSASNNPIILYYNKDACFLLNSIIKDIYEFYESEIFANAITNIDNFNKRISYIDNLCKDLGDFLYNKIMQLVEELSNEFPLAYDKKLFDKFDRVISKIKDNLINSPVKNLNSKLEENYKDLLNIKQSSSKLNSKYKDFILKNNLPERRESLDVFMKNLEDNDFISFFTKNIEFLNSLKSKLDIVNAQCESKNLLTLGKSMEDLFSTINSIDLGYKNYIKVKEEKKSHLFALLRRIFLASIVLVIGYFLVPFLFSLIIDLILWIWDIVSSIFSWIWSGICWVASLVWDLILWIWSGICWVASLVWDLVCYVCPLLWEFIVSLFE